MFEDLLYGHNVFLLVVAFAGALMLAAELGFRRGRAIRERLGEYARGQIMAAPSVILALLGLLLAFTFSMAESRYEIRRNLVVDEANALETAWLRSGALPEAEGDQARALLRQYVAARLKPTQPGATPADAAAAAAAADALQARLWSVALTAARADPNAYMVEMFVQSLNDVFDFHVKHHAEMRNHIPDAVVLLLVFVSLVAIVATGYAGGMAQHRNVLFTHAVALLIALVVLLIVDLDRPREGLIQTSQQPLLDLQQLMAQPAPKAP